MTIERTLHLIAFLGGMAIGIMDTKLLHGTDLVGLGLAVASAIAGFLLVEVVAECVR